MAGNVPHQTETNLLRIVQGIRDLFAGRSNAVGTVTLTVNQATTTVTATNCGEDSQVMLTPKTANAATEYGAGGCYVSSVGNGSFVITHVNSATTLRTFGWVAFG